MAKNNNLGDFLTDIANSIRAKTGESSAINAQDFSTEIANIPTGKTMLDNTVVFDVQNNEYTIISVNSGNTIQEPTAPSVSGYAFRGWYTQSGGSGSKITFPYTPLNDTTFYAYMAQANTCTVSGLGSSSPSSVSFTKGLGFTVSGLGIEEVTFNGDVFIKIPTMYRKVEAVSNNQINSFTISDVKLDSSYLPYTCFVDENGNELPYILIGKYWNTDSSGCVSTQESTPYSQNIGPSRTAAVNRGTGYQIFDWQIQKLWQDLIICLRETVNTNAGTGFNYDELGIYWSNYEGFIDGIVNGKNGYYWYCTKPTQYVDITYNATMPSGYTATSYSAPNNNNQRQYEIQKLGYDTNQPFVNFPFQLVSNSNFDTYYCDYFDLLAGDNGIIKSNAGGSSFGYGIYNCNTRGGLSNPCMCRLCYRPIQ